MSDPRVVVDGVTANDPAGKAGLMDGDIIRGLNGIPEPNANDVISYVRSHAGQPVVFNIQRLTQNLTITITPEKDSSLSGQGFIGTGLDQIANVRYPWYYALGEGLTDTWYGGVNIVTGLWGLVSGHIALSNVGGPVAIAKLVGQAREMGFLTLLQLTAFLSINLAILNVLPFPALDGGRILFLIIEKVRRKRNNPAVEQFVNTIGFVLLLILMVAVTIKDIIHK
jgi:regulator of sigma E protease